MPPKKSTKNAKARRAPRSSEDEVKPHEIDVNYNPDIIDTMLIELKSQMEGKCDQVTKDTEFMITSIQQAFHLELIKLPSQVKQMSVKKFNEQFGNSISLQAVAMGAIKGVSSNSTSREVFETPAHTFKGRSIVPKTVVRNPREGEAILSTNGSPLGEFQTIKKVPKQINTFVPQTPGVILKTGEVLDIENIDVENMSKENKFETIQKMQSVMDNMQQLMQKLSQKI